MNQKDTLSILQYNVRKSRDTVMATMLRDHRIAEMDILAVQEPWRNPFSAATHHPAKDTFHLCYPPDAEPGYPARVCFFINRRLDHTAWHFTPHGRDACTITIQRPKSPTGQSRLVIHNVYNPLRSSEETGSTLPMIQQLIEAHEAEDQVVVGDFNLHHGMWGGTKVRHADKEAEELISIMDSCNMEMCFKQAR